MKSQAVIIGYSGHAYVVLDILLANNYVIAGYCEKQTAGSNPYDLRYLGYENDPFVLQEIKKNEVFLGIGDNAIREKAAEYLLKNDVQLPNAIHPSAIIAKNVNMKHANIVMPGVVINSFAQLGKGSICNTSSIIEHECVLGNYTHIGPGAVLAGNVKIGNNCFIGANSVIRQGVQIGNKVIIGAGSVIIEDIKDGLTVFGNPGRIYKPNF